MKVKMKKVMRVISVVGLLMIGVISTASAKFWGWETSETTDWADGTCAYRETCKVHYIFWIAGEEQCRTETIGCIYN